MSCYESCLPQLTIISGRLPLKIAFHDSSFSLNGNSSLKRQGRMKYRAQIGESVNVVPKRCPSGSHPKMSVE